MNAVNWLRCLGLSLIGSPFVIVAALVVAG
jgi:hypothetical protein